MTRHALSFGFGLLILLSLDAVAAPAASTAAPPETVAPSETTAVGNATTIPLAPSASTAATAAPATATQPAAAPAAATQVNATPAASTQAAASATSAPAPAASAATPATAPQSPAPTAIPKETPSATLCSSGHASMPGRGMDMTNVEHIFGTPLEKHEAVGKPPITRWDYADYAVYFEYNLVLHSVMKSAPFGDAQVQTC